MSGPYDLSSGDKGWPALRRADTKYWARVAEHFSSGWPGSKPRYESVPEPPSNTPTSNSLEAQVEVEEPILQQDLKTSEE